MDDNRAFAPFEREVTSLDANMILWTDILRPEKFDISLS